VRRRTDRGNVTVPFSGCLTYVAGIAGEPKR
jgi:hypothetical protein